RTKRPAQMRLATFQVSPSLCRALVLLNVIKSEVIRMQRGLLWTHALRLREVYYRRPVMASPIFSRMTTEISQTPVRGYSAATRTQNNKGVKGPFPVEMDPCGTLWPDELTK
ncbi:MAG: hypothetical protein RLZZ141_2215, partial [Pseudomonadota bacterium]